MAENLRRWPTAPWLCIVEVSQVSHDSIHCPIRRAEVSPNVKIRHQLVNTRLKVLSCDW